MTTWKHRFYRFMNGFQVAQATYNGVFYHSQRQGSIEIATVRALSCSVYIWNGSYTLSSSWRDSKKCTGHAFCDVKSTLGVAKSSFSTSVKLHNHIKTRQ